MANILINGFSAKVGGGKVIFEKFLTSLYEDNSSTHHYYVIASNVADYSRFNCSHITIVKVPTFYQRGINLPWYYVVFIPRLVKRQGINAVFNFADLILPVSVPQVYFFDWAYFVYPESSIWRRMGFRDLFARKVKSWLIKIALKYVDKTIAQTSTMAKRLRMQHNLQDVEVIPSAVMPVSLDANNTVKQREAFELPKERCKLLILSNFAPHKNFDVVVPLAKLMKKHHSNLLLVTTLELSESEEARALFEQLDRDGTSDYVKNIGRVAPLDINNLFAQCDGLFFPTLLESYGLPFIEAMQNGKPIFTSDFDFTRDVCAGAATYFDPFDADTIFKLITETFKNPHVLDSKLRTAEKILSELPDWDSIYNQYKQSIAKVLVDH